MRQSALRASFHESEQAELEATPTAPLLCTRAVASGGRPVLAFERGGQQFAVIEEWRQAGGRYSGYCDGVLSLRADRPDVTARALLRKHVIRQPVRRLIALQGPRDHRAYSGLFL